MEGISLRGTFFVCNTAVTFQSILYFATKYPEIL
jgi:hypothetical protein